MLRHYDKPKRNRTREQLLPGPEWKAANLISHVVWLEGAKIEIDEDQILVSQKWKCINSSVWLIKTNCPT